MSEETIKDNTNEMVKSDVEDCTVCEVKPTNNTNITIIPRITDETSDKNNKKDSDVINKNTDETISKNIDESINKNFDEIINTTTIETINKNIEIVHTNIIEQNNVCTDKQTESCEENCIFCKIITTNDPSIILEPRSDQFAIIRDIKPVATNHFLILSCKHIKSAKELQPCEEDRNLIKNMIRAANEILINNRCDLNYTRMGFHWPPFYTIAHMHLHVISPVDSMSMFNRFIAFNPIFSYVFVDVNYVKNRIENNKETDLIKSDEIINQSQ